jgi:hypothetical protein
MTMPRAACRATIPQTPATNHLSEAGALMRRALLGPKIYARDLVVLVYIVPSGERAKLV